ncbi:hypothetical protein B0T26DRAFT_688151 [Lasiosphaeria miniovina]|uniref:Uncharacterized protein n=1 Tax=Lasiosphaeria miniovina TaxID=1954250 RepID=A0AA40BHH5_9PEZI|nr:uncharacterized protein B0T26DRAFT_688151 [Lasiosphaeria miniovina]KAK0734334.1 hypothetical protein B0T26DRAFT_688151 [Lasiosphaeria miniovina]
MYSVVHLLGFCPIASLLGVNVWMKLELQLSAEHLVTCLLHKWRALSVLSARASRTVQRQSEYNCDTFCRHGYLTYRRQTRAVQYFYVTTLAFTLSTGAMLLGMESC